VSVPSKTYSIMAAGRPVVASIDEGTAVPEILAESGAGIAVAPDDAVAFTEAIRSLVSDPEHAGRLGANGRTWVEQNASPGAVGAAYDQLVRSLARTRP
jgi:colanic acid biosynthesis glycosyl transferase WcaI